MEVKKPFLSDITDCKQLINNLVGDKTEVNSVFYDKEPNVDAYNLPCDFDNDKFRATFKATMRKELKIRKSSFCKHVYNTLLEIII